MLRGVQLSSTLGLSTLFFNAMNPNSEAIRQRIKMDIFLMYCNYELAWYPAKIVGEKSNENKKK